MTVKTNNEKKRWNKVEYWEAFEKVVSRTKTYSSSVHIKVEHGCISINNQYFLHFEDKKSLRKAVSERMHSNNIRTKLIELESEMLSEAEVYALEMLEGTTK